MTDLKSLLDLCAQRHSHLCPRQVLGVRIGLAGMSALAMQPPVQGKRLLAIVETDGCFSDGVEVATGCTVGHRTLRVEDYGKIAAVFVDIKTGQAVRVAPNLHARQRASAHIAGETRHYFAQLQAYQSMSDDELLMMQEVRLRTPIKTIVSRAGRRVNCSNCGEEIINEREQIIDERLYCITCAQGGYYNVVEYVARKYIECPGLMYENIGN
jgi:formylmethanofuran dehydrogenase subunit E